MNVGCSGNTTPLHTSAWGYLDNNMIVYSIKVGEEYATTPNGTIFVYDGKGSIGEPDVRSNVSYAYNGVKEWFNGKNYNFNPYFLTGDTQFNSGVCRFMTNSPRSRWIRVGDYQTLAALNYSDITTDLNSRQIYSALFSFYDDNNSLISTGRTYNVYDNCGVRPDCSYYDGFWETPYNWAEQQVVYLGVGTPNITEHGINFPDNTQYYKVQLEGTLDTPEPPTPEPDDFDGCSCHEYEYFNISLEASVVIDYLNCTGATDTISIPPESFGNWCACQNTNTSLDIFPGSQIIDSGECDACVCKTYRVFNPDQDFTNIFTYTSCSGSTETGSIPPDDFVDICACEGSVSGLPFTLLGDCPLPFNEDCRLFGVSTNVEYVYEITYTGCCGTLQTISVPPGVGILVKANNPFPLGLLWEAIDLDAATEDCPPPPVPPSPTTFGTGDNIICRNVCDNSLMYFSYTGETIEVGQFVNYENTAYEILAVGGGGFIPLSYPYVFDDENSALDSFPCPLITTGSCLTTTFISEPFYFYLDGNCS